MISGLENITTATILLIIVAGFAAGWVDAVRWPTTRSLTLTVEPDAYPAYI